MRAFLRGLLRSLRSDAWDRRQMIRERGVSKWLAFEWRFVRFLWQGRNEMELERSERTLADRFMEIRLNVDVTGAMTRWDLIEFARLSGCEDLIEQARWPAEKYAAFIENTGGNYPLEAVRKSYAESD